MQTCHRNTFLSIGLGELTEGNRIDNGTVMLSVLVFLPQCRIHRGYQSGLHYHCQRATAHEQQRQRYWVCVVEDQK